MKNYVFWIVEKDMKMWLIIVVMYVILKVFERYEDLDMINCLFLNY